MVEYTKVKKCSLYYLPKYVTTNISFEIITLCEKWQNTEFFWPVFSRIWTEYVDLRSKYPHSVQIWENTNQKKLHI